MADPLRHRQTKGAATDMVDLTPPRHIPTLLVSGLLDVLLFAVIRPVSHVAHSACYALHAEGDSVSVVPSPWFQANACVRRLITRFGTRKSSHLTRARRRGERKALERPSRSSLF